MEKQMRAERDRRATILTAEGVKQSQILTAEGEKQAAVLKAEGARTSAILRAEGESKAIETVFQAIHDGAPDQQLLSYQYLQMLPQLAQGEANKIFIIPSEFNQALGNIGSALGRFGGGDEGPSKPKPKPRPSGRLDAIDEKAQADAAAAAAAAEQATAEAEGAATYTPPGVDAETAGEIAGLTGDPLPPDGPEPPSPPPPPAAPPTT
jgi:regulator of protease activity HflC (stomatin/prohibitin superfamily)